MVSTIVPKISIRFASYHQLSNTFGNDSFGKNLFCGMGAGVVESLTVVTPSEVVKIRQQDVKTQGSKRGQIETVKLVLKENGVSGLYRGWLPTTMRQSFQQGIKFSLFYKFKEWLDPFQLNTSTSDLVAGFLANSGGAVLNTPLDVVKSQIQRQVGQEAKFTGVIQCFKVIHKEEGDCE